MDDDSNLKKKLEAWRVEPRIPSSFQREVWQRIAAKEAARRNSLRYQLVDWAVSLLLTPRYAVALIIAGAFLGDWRGTSRGREYQLEVIKISRNPLHWKPLIPTSTFLHAESPRKKAVWVLFATLGIAVATFCAYFHIATHHMTVMISGAGRRKLDWLRMEFNLTDEQFSKIKALQEAYEPKCGQMCQRIMEANANLDQLMSANTTHDAPSRGSAQTMCNCTGGLPQGDAGAYLCRHARSGSPCGQRSVFANDEEMDY